MYGGSGYEEAILAYDTNLRLNPADPFRFTAFGGQASANYQLRRYEVAIECAGQALQVRYGFIQARALLAASLAQLDRTEEAAAELAEIMLLKPDFSTASYANLPMREAAYEHLFEGLYKAGLPR